MNKKDMVEFVARYGGIAQRSISNVTLGDKFTFLDLDKSSQKGVAKKIDGMTVKGRKIRMNKDS